jgi:hypothetical protein
LTAAKHLIWAVTQAQIVLPATKKFLAGILQSLAWVFDSLLATNN